MSAQYDFIPGFDPSSLTSITQAQLLEMISQIAPLSNIGGIIVMSGASNAHPDVTNNARFIRYIWLDTQTAGNPVIKLYTGTYPSDTAADWSAFAIANNSITTLMVQALAVTVAKLSSTGGTNGQLLKVNASGGFDFVDFASFMSANAVPLTAINKSTAGDNFVLQYKTSDGLVLWRAVDASVFGAGSIGINRLANPGAGYVLVGDSTTGVASAIIFDTAAKVSSFFAANVIPTTRLEGTGTPATGDYLRWNGTNWAKWTPQYQSSDTVMTAADSAIIASTAHGLGVVPSHVNVQLVSKANNGATGYAVGDIIPFAHVTTGTTTDGTSTIARNILTVWCNATNYGLNQNLSAAPAFMNLTPKAGGALVSVTKANFILDWNVRVVLRA